MKINKLWELDDIATLHKKGLSYELCYFVRGIYNSCQKSNGNKSEKEYVSFIEAVKNFCNHVNEETLIYRSEYVNPLLESIPECFNKPRLRRTLFTPLYILQNLADDNSLLFSFSQMAKRRVKYVKVENIDEDGIYIPLGGKESRTLIPGNLCAVKKGNYIVYDRNNPFNKVLICTSLKGAREGRKKMLKKCEENIKRSYLCENTAELTEKNKLYKHISKEQLISTFGFKDISFSGNFSGTDKELCYCNLYDAFSDLALALRCDNKDVSFNGRLGIKVCEYLKDESCAVCDTVTDTIFLDVLYGGGNIAHEWFHYLDHVLSQCHEVGVFASESQNNDAVNDLVHSLKYNRFGKETKFYSSSVLMDKNVSERWGEEVEYWQDTCELAARGFAIYLRCKFPSVSKYLCRKNELNCIEPFMKKGERTEIFNAYDRVLRQAKRNKIFMSFC